MTDDHPNGTRADEAGLRSTIDEKERRKLRARRESSSSVWFGLGMFGLVGWSVAIPTLIGIAVGVYIDTAYPSQYSWTLMGLVLGVLLGCLNAWLWVRRERRSIEEVRQGVDHD